MSSFLFTATISTLLLLTLLSSSTAFLVDLDGDDLKNGGDYYIVVSSSEEGLTYTQRNDGCPLYIISDTDDNSHGTPVRISSPLKKAFLSIEDRVTLAFVNTSGSAPCAGSLRWKQTLNPFSRKTYITTGGSAAELVIRPFKIVKRDRSLLPTFELQYCGSRSAEGFCSDVGLFSSGLLGITESTIISFKKAFTVLQMSTS